MLQVINRKGWENRGVSVAVLREDLKHPYVSGNKGIKLKYHLLAFKTSGKKTVVSFGGAFSNHLVALAAAAAENGFQTIGIVRGEEVSNAYLSFMKDKGMLLHFVSREDYRLKDDVSFQMVLLSELRNKGLIKYESEVFFIPEGGGGEYGIKGASEIMSNIPDETDFIACACGTGTTIAGIASAMKSHQRAIGISALKAEGLFEKVFADYGIPSTSADFHYGYHFGGYAKYDDNLVRFCHDFTRETGIPVEPVYTGKLFFGINDLIENGYFPKGSNIVVLHSGGVYSFTRFGGY